MGYAITYLQQEHGCVKGICLNDKNEVCIESIHPNIMHHAKAHGMEVGDIILTVCKEKKDDFNVTSESIYNNNFNFSILRRPVTIKYKRNKYSITFLPEHDKLGDFLNKNEKVYVQRIDDKIRSFVEPYGMRIDDIIDSVSTKLGTNEVQYKVNDLN